MQLLYAIMACDLCQNSHNANRRRLHAQRKQTAVAQRKQTAIAQRKQTAVAQRVVGVLAEIARHTPSSNSQSARCGGHGAALRACVRPCVTKGASSLKSVRKLEKTWGKNRISLARGSSELILTPIGSL